MLAAFQCAMDYCAGMTYDAFLGDRRTRDPVVRNIEIVGEAARGLSERMRRETSHVPWKSIAGMRDRLIHGYFGVNWEVVWTVVQEDLPVLIKAVQEIAARKHRDTD